MTELEDLKNRVESLERWKELTIQHAFIRIRDEDRKDLDRKVSKILKCHPNEVDQAMLTHQARSEALVKVLQDYNENKSNPEDAP